MARIIFQISPDRDQPFNLTKDSLTIGRNNDCDISISHDFVSSRHAQIKKQSSPNGDEWELSDLKSSNGTFVNGIRITKSTLSHNDQLRFGTLEARFESEIKPTTTQAIALEKLEGEAREAFLRTTLLRNQIKGLTKQVADLEDRKATLAQPINADTSSKITFAGEIIERLDRIDDLLAALGRQASNDDLQRHVQDIRQSFLELLEQLGVTSYIYPSGTRITEKVSPRVRAVGKDVEALGKGDTVGRISRTRRPGYEIINKDDDSTIIVRRAEVTADVPTAKA